MAPRAYVITPDRIDNPIVVDVELELYQPLDDELCDLREAYLDIKLQATLAGQVCGAESGQQRLGILEPGEIRHFEQSRAASFLDAAAGDR